MKLFIFCVLLTGCLSTPIQQGRQFRDETRNSDGTVVGKYGYQDPSGALRIVKYTAGKDGFVATGDGVPVAPSAPGQPMVWTGEQPIVVEPAPLAYANKQQVLAVDDQQRPLTVEDDVEAREEVASDQESKPDDESKVDTEPKVDTEEKVDDEPKVKQNVQNSETPVVPVVQSVKTPKKQDSQVDNLQDRDQTFPQVLSGQRRLVEPQPESGVKGKKSQQPSGIVSPVGRKHIVYQSVQHGIPLTIQEHREVPLVRVPVSPSISGIQNQVVSGVKGRPVIQYQIGQPGVIQQIVNPLDRRPGQVLHSGVLQPIVGGQRQVQYILQPVVHQNLGLDQRQVVIQPEVQQIFGLDQGNVRFIQQGINAGQSPIVDQRYFSVQQVANLDDRQEEDRKEIGVQPVSQPEVSQIGVGVDHRQVHVVSGVQNIVKPGILEQRHIVKPDVVQQVGGVVDQRHVQVVQSGVLDSGNIDYRVFQQSVQPQSVGNDQIGKVQHVIGYQYIIPTERRNAVSDERVIVQSQPKVDHVVQMPLSNQQVVISPWVSQSGWQLRQPMNQIVSDRNVHSVIQQQVPVSDLQAYYQSIRESPVSQIGQIQQQAENQYVSQLGQWPSVMQPIQLSGIQGVQEPIRRVDSDVEIGRQPVVLVDRQVEQRPRIIPQNYGTKSMVNV